MSNYKSKTATARNKAKGYVAALTPVNTSSDDESVASVDKWGSQIDKPLKKKTKRNKGKGKPTKKTANNRKGYNPLNQTMTLILILCMICMITKIRNRILGLVYLDI